MRKTKAIIFIAIGAALIISALLLFGFNKNEDNMAGEASRQAVAEIKTQIDQNSADVSINDANLDPEMPVCEIDGYEYVGYITIPSIEIDLPVMAQWDYDRLKIAPCRQFGSSRTDDLVIAAHNYSSHFGNIDELKEGDSIIFTDMEGIVNTYVVEKTNTLEPTDVDKVENSGYDLVLYTCTYGGKTRVTVFCNRAQ